MEREELRHFVTVQCLILLILAFAWLWWHPELGLLQRLQLKGADLLLGLAGGVLLLGFSVLGTWLWPALRRAQAHLDRTIFGALEPSDAFYLGLLSGVSEEIFFRGVLQYYWSLWLASALFGLLHLPGKKHSVYALWAGLSGLLMGAIYLWTGNLLTVILMHVLNNILAILLLPLFRRLYTRSEDEVL